MSDSSTNISTNVPAPQLTDAGFIAPSEQDILSGVLADLNNVLGGNANPALSTPQGQLAMSMTAILGDALAAELAVFNGVDPDRASGVMQDAIGRIYFMERRPATPTVVTVQLTLNGGGNTIPAGTPIASDVAGQIYALQEDLTLPMAQYTEAVLACTTSGAVMCAANSLSLYQGGLGIASLTNAAPGITGQDEEGRADFENRRQQSVEANSVGQNASILGTLLKLQDVSDAYVMDNPTSQPLQVGSVSLPPHCLYCVVAGGADQEIGRAILDKKSPGCETIGSQSVTVQDDNPAYHGNGPVYRFHFDRAQSVTVFVFVTMARNNSVPLEAETTIKTAIMQAVTNGTLRPRFGATLYASRLASIVNILGAWAEVLAFTLSLSADGPGSTSLSLPVNQLPVFSNETINVIFQ